MLTTIEGGKRSRWKKVVLLSACLCCQACHSSPSSWTVSHLETDDYRGVRLVAPVHLPRDGVTLEINYRDKPSPHLKSVLQVHAQPISPDQRSPYQTQVWMKIGKDTFSFLAYRHQGGYRLALPLEVQEVLIEALKNGYSITWIFEGYEATIEASGFQEAFKRFKAHPTWVQSFLKKFKL